jgi:hypothetical protein
VGELPQNLDPYDPDREAAAAESETEPFVIGIAIVAAHELVRDHDVAPQADTNAPPRIACGLKKRYRSHREAKNDQAAKRRPVIGPVVCHEENLERAKGLEPSTPTLARSCSTTELHPHPRWRRTRAVNGRPMPNADRECNSPHAVRCRADQPISSTMAANRTETPPNGVCRPVRRPDVRPPAQRQAIRALIPCRLPNPARQYAPHPIDGPLAGVDGHRPPRRGSIIRPPMTHPASAD